MEISGENRDSAPGIGALPAGVPTLLELETVHLAARLGSLGAAARVSGISQQAASARVRSAERALGIPILARSATGVRVTTRGRAVLGWIEDVLRSVERLDRGVRALGGRDRVSVAASMTVAEHLLPAWLVEIRSRFPDVGVELVQGNSADVADLVRSGEADLGFVEGMSGPEGLVSVDVREDELVLVVPPGHPWAEVGEISVDELRATRLVQRESGSGTREILDAMIPGLAPPRVELRSSAAVKGAIAAGGGPAVLSRLAVGQEIADGRLIVVGVRGRVLSRTLRAVWRTGAMPRGIAAELVAVSRGI